LGGMPFIWSFDRLSLPGPARNPDHGAVRHVSDVLNLAVYSARVPVQTGYLFSFNMA